MRFWVSGCVNCGFGGVLGCLLGLGAFVGFCILWVKLGV